MSTKKTERTLDEEARNALLETLRSRFEAHPSRHAGLDWDAVRKRLEATPAALWSLQQMESTGGEPDVVGLDEKSGEYVFFDCAPQSPGGRRSVCYDGPARTGRKKHPPERSAVEMADDMGVRLLTVDEYHALQDLGDFDTKTSSWLATPEGIRALGGAVFGDFRYGTVFVYHNGADSYYAARGFRSSLRI